MRLQQRVQCVTACEGMQSRLVQTVVIRRISSPGPANNAHASTTGHQQGDALAHTLPRAHLQTVPASHFTSDQGASLQEFLPGGQLLPPH
jgi:hypothetical protein